MADHLRSTFLSFLYPFLIGPHLTAVKQMTRSGYRVIDPIVSRYQCPTRQLQRRYRHQSAVVATNATSESPTSHSNNNDNNSNSSNHQNNGELPVAADLSHLDPSPSDYSRFIFQDKCPMTVVAGSGGSGCVSFLREKYIEEGPPNGGDGGTGGSIYIQAVEGLTSLHKLARRGVIRAGRGRNGQGKNKGGKRGEDVLLQVPVGTVVREVGRHDPIEEETLRLRTVRRQMPRDSDEYQAAVSRRDRWVLYPGSQPSDFLTTAFPPAPPPRRSDLAALEPRSPIHLDLSKHMDQPILLAAGAVGGHGNPHFVSKSIWRPRFATKGEGGKTLHLEFELKLLADVGLVGFPNAGKSTLLRSLTNSRTRIGNWEFTTLTPHIGTVVLDDFKGRPVILDHATRRRSKRTHFTIADIPGLVEDAHLDRGLGLGFLRHIERAHVLSFVIDLSAGNPIQTLKQLWRELGEYDRMRDVPGPEYASPDRMVAWNVSGMGPATIHVNEDGSTNARFGGGSFCDLNDNSSSNLRTKKSLPPLSYPPIYTRPWFVVATKADLPGTETNFHLLREYLTDIQNGKEEHPSGHEEGRRDQVCVIPVSALRAEGVDGIPALIMRLLEES